MVGFEIRWLIPLQRVTHPYKIGCLIKILSDGEAAVLEIWEVWSTSSLFFPDPLWPGEVPVRFPSMDQIDLFKNYSYSWAKQKEVDKNLNMNVKWTWFPDLKA